MTDTQSLISLLTFAAIATATPGAATVLVVASGARFGFRESVPLLLGMALGLGSLCAGAAAGLGALIQARPELEWAIRALGSGYLLWLAWRVARSGAPNTASATAVKPTGIGGGFLLLALNPKAWTVALSAAAAFSGLTTDLGAMAVMMGGVFAAAAIVSLSLWCAGGLVLARALKTAAQWQVVNGALGALLAGSIAFMWV